MNHTKRKVIFDVGHPAHVHLFRNAMGILAEIGCEIKIVARPQEITLDLLRAYNLEYESLKHYKGLINKAIGMFRIDLEYYKIARRFRPEIIVSAGSPYSGHISRALRIPHITFGDTPPARGTIFYLVAYALHIPFADLVCTPDVFPIQFNPKKHIRYNGYHELAYLHPKYFMPDNSILKEIGLSKNSRFIIVRFASWDAIHDIGHRGFKSTNERIDFVRILAKRFKVFVTSEVMIPELKEYEIPIAPEKAHDLLAFATMYVGEGATMASEAGVLGVPWIFLYTKTLPYLDDQEKKYGLGFTVNDARKALQIAFNLLNNGKLKEEWEQKRKRLISEKIDVTDFMTNLILKVGNNSAL